MADTNAGDDERTKSVAIDPHGGLSVPRLLFGLLRQRFTGIMHVDQPGPSEQVPRRVWFRGGMPVFTDWALQTAVLGELLLSRGAVDTAQLQSALMVLADPNDTRLLGQILLEEGVIDQTTLTATLRQQCAHKLEALFAVGQDGSAEVVLEAVAHNVGKSDGLAQVNVLALLLHGIDSQYPVPRIEEEMGAALQGDLVATAAFPRYQAQFGFRPTDARILEALCRGGRLESIVGPGAPRDRTLALVYALWASQMLRTGEDAARAIAQGATAQAAAIPAPGQKTKPSPAKAKATPSKVAPAPPVEPKPKPKPARVETKPAPPPPKPAAKPKAPPPPKAAKPDPAPSEPADAFEAELEVLEDKVKADAHAFNLFGVELDADRKTVRAAWNELSQRFHPDALEGMGRSALRGRVEPVFAALSEAYSTLSNKEEREQLRLVLEAGGTGKSTEDASRVVRNAVEAEMIARDGDKLLKKGGYDRALEAYRRALELSPEDSDVQAALQWCLYQLSDKKAQAANLALANLATVIEAAPKCARAHYYRGMVLMGMNNEALAKAAFHAALEADKRFVDAERQIRAIRLRKKGDKAKPDTQSGSISDSLRGWFTKK